MCFCCLRRNRNFTFFDGSVHCWKLSTRNSTAQHSGTGQPLAAQSDLARSDTLTTVKSNPVRNSRKKPKRRLCVFVIELNIFRYQYSATFLLHHHHHNHLLILSYHLSKREYIILSYRLHRIGSTRLYDSLVTSTCSTSLALATQ